MWSELSGRQKSGLIGLIVVLALAAGYWLGRGATDSVQPVERTPIVKRDQGAEASVTEPTQGMVRVHVKGAVAEPGVYDLVVGSRVEDAIEIAGGGVSGADWQSVNLAKELEDGDQVMLKFMESDPVTDVVYPVGINTAPVSVLEQLPGIGPGLATEIVRWRSEVAPFETETDLERVPGIGPETVRQILPYIKFD